MTKSLIIRITSNHSSQFSRTRHNTWYVHRKVGSVVDDDCVTASLGLTLFSFILISTFELPNSLGHLYAVEHTC